MFFWKTFWMERLRMFKHMRQFHCEVKEAHSQLFRLFVESGCLKNPSDPANWTRAHNEWHRICRHRWQSNWHSKWQSKRSWQGSWHARWHSHCTRPGDLAFFVARRHLSNLALRQNSPCPLTRFWFTCKNGAVRGPQVVKKAGHVRSAIIRAVADRSMHSLSNAQRESSAMAYPALPRSALATGHSTQGRLTAALYRGAPYRQVQRQLHTSPTQQYKSIFGLRFAQRGVEMRFRLPKPSTFLAQSWSSSPRSLLQTLLGHRQSRAPRPVKAPSTASTLDSSYYFEEPQAGAHTDDDARSLSSFRSDASFLSDGRIGRGCYVEFDFAPTFQALSHGVLTDEIVEQFQRDMVVNTNKMKNTIDNIKRISQLGELPVTFEPQGAMALKVFFPNSDYQQVDALLQDVDIYGAKIVSLDTDAGYASSGSSFSAPSSTASPTSRASSPGSADSVSVCNMLSSAIVVESAGVFDGNATESLGSYDADTPSLTSANTRTDSELLLA